MSLRTDACIFFTDLRGKCSLIRQQSLTKRLLVTLVDVSKAQNVLLVGRRKLQEGFVACDKVLLLACDQEHAVPAREPQKSRTAQVQTGRLSGISVTMDPTNLTLLTHSSLLKLQSNKNVLLSPPVELLDRTQLIKKLLVDETRHLQELVVGDKLVHDLSFHPPRLQR